MVHPKCIPKIASPLKRDYLNAVDIMMAYIRVYIKYYTGVSKNMTCAKVGPNFIGSVISEVTEY